MTSTSSWHDPRDYARGLSGEKNLVFLYSGMEPGRYSLLAWDLEETCDSLNDFTKRLNGDQNKWFGFLGYGLRNQFEKLERSKSSYIQLPDFLMMKFKNILIFDHQSKTISSPPNFKPVNATASAAPKIKSPVASNMSDRDFTDKVKTILEKINSGELYQCNLTRKFHGEFSNTPDSFQLFHKLSEISPAPYSAYIRFDNKTIISASPEKFLTVENGIATTTPIKGTLSSSRPAAELANSEKDKAENLMIVDLMRNDLSRSCDDVKVEKLFEITSYAKYHHMSSTITGKPRTTALDVAKSCFPPGSMTGAPKIQAIKLANELEKIERGLYSGAIGYFSGKDICDLSVVIRTLIIEDNKFEFQVGSGIVADSVPEKELDEIYVKASAIFEILGTGR